MGIRENLKLAVDRDRKTQVSYKKSEWHWVSHSTYRNPDAVSQCPQNLEEIPSNTNTVKRKDRIKVLTYMKGLNIFLQCTFLVEAIEGCTNLDKAVH